MRCRDALRLVAAAVCFLFAVSFSALAAAQSCPDDYPLYCSNCDGYCCPESHPYCTDNCECAADDGSGGGGDTCPDDYPLYCSNCDGYCCPESHPYCTDDCQCAADDGSGGDDVQCYSDEELCGGEYCIPEGEVCCASVGRPDIYCPSGTECNPDGTCSQPTSGGSDSDSTSSICDPGYVTTEATCGGDQCSCAAPCTADSECVSGCCADGYCSLPCVCQQGAYQEIGCAGDSPTSSTGSGSAACSTGLSSPAPLALLGLLLVSLVAVRRLVFEPEDNCSATI